MGVESKIAWTDATWTIVTGCSKVSQACASCYAEELSLRRGWSKLPWTAANARENVKLHEDRLSWPLKWRQPKKIFVTSMGDLFHEEVPFSFIVKVFAVMQLAQRHTFQLLTKRTQRMAEFYDWLLHSPEGKSAWLKAVVGAPQGELEGWSTEWPFRNIWCGTTVEDQKNADERIPWLLQVPAAVHWLSMEPLLGPVDLTRATGSTVFDTGGEGPRDKAPIDWIVVGGESGKNFRPLEMAWARDLRDQCSLARTAYFYKQGSGRMPGNAPYLVEEDGRKMAYRQFPGELTAPALVTEG